jgi:hypothetical protein
MPSGHGHHELQFYFGKMLHEVPYSSKTPKQKIALEGSIKSRARSWGVITCDQSI